MVKITIGVLACAALLAGPAPLLAQKYTVVAVCHTENKVVEIDPASGRTISTFIVPGEWVGETHEGAITADGKTMYVSTPYQKKVLVLDLATFQQKAAIESEFFSPPGDPPVRPHRPARVNVVGSSRCCAEQRREQALRVGRVRRTARGGCRGSEERQDEQDRHRDCGQLSLGPAEDRQTLFSDARQQGRRHRHEKRTSILRAIPVQGGPNGVDFSPNGEVWVNGDRDGSVTVIDSKTDTVVKVIQPRAKGAGRIAASPDGRFVAASHGPEVSVIDVATKQIVADFKIGRDDDGHGFPLFSPDSNTLHVMNEFSNDMVTFDMKTMKQVGGRVAIGEASFGGGIRLLK